MVQKTTSFVNSFILYAFILSGGLLFVEDMMAVTTGNQEKIQQKIETVQEKRERHQTNIELADSMIVHGDTIRQRTSSDILQATDRMHERARIYRQERKELDRNLKNAPVREVAKTRLAIRTLDQEYRQELNEYDAFMRVAIEDAEIGTRDFDRGREIRREAQKGLIEVSVLLEELQEEIRRNNLYNRDIVNR